MKFSSFSGVTSRSKNPSASCGSSAALSFSAALASSGGGGCVFFFDFQEECVV